MQLRAAVKSWRFNAEANTGAAAAAAAADSSEAERIVRETYQKQVGKLRAEVGDVKSANAKLELDLRQAREQCEQLTTALDAATVVAEQAESKLQELEVKSMQTELSIELNKDAVGAKEKAEAEIMRVAIDRDTYRAQVDTYRAQVAQLAESERRERTNCANAEEERKTAQHKCAAVQRDLQQASGDAKRIQLEAASYAEKAELKIVTLEDEREKHRELIGLLMAEAN